MVVIFVCNLERFDGMHLLEGVLDEYFYHQAECLLERGHLLEGGHQLEHLCNCQLFVSQIMPV